MDTTRKARPFVILKDRVFHVIEAKALHNRLNILQFSIVSMLVNIFVLPRNLWTFRD